LVWTFYCSSPRTPGCWFRLPLRLHTFIPTHAFAGSLGWFALLYPHLLLLPLPCLVFYLPCSITPCVLVLVLVPHYSSHSSPWFFPLLVVSCCTFLPCSLLPLPCYLPHTTRLRYPSLGLPSPFVHITHTVLAPGLPPLCPHTVLLYPHPSSLFGSYPTHLCTHTACLPLPPPPLTPCPYFTLPPLPLPAVFPCPLPLYYLPTSPFLPHTPLPTHRADPPLVHLHALVLVLPCYFFRTALPFAYRRLPLCCLAFALYTHLPDYAICELTYSLPHPLHLQLPYTLPSCCRALPHVTVPLPPSCCPLLAYTPPRITRFCPLTLPLPLLVYTPTPPLCLALVPHCCTFRHLPHYTLVPPHTHWFEHTVPTFPHTHTHHTPLCTVWLPLATCPLCPPPLPLGRWIPTVAHCTSFGCTFPLLLVACTHALHYVTRRDHGLRTPFGSRNTAFHTPLLPGFGSHVPHSSPPHPTPLPFTPTLGLFYPIHWFLVPLGYLTHCPIYPAPLFGSHTPHALRLVPTAFTCIPTMVLIYFTRKHGTPHTSLLAAPHPFVATPALPWTPHTFPG